MFETLTTLFRARSAEAEEALIDRNAVTLLAQHLRDAKAEIAGARAAIARLMAREAERDRALAALAETLARREREAAAALAKGDEGLAADLAEAILKLEDRRAEEAAAQKTLRARIAEAREALEGAERRFSDLADELRFAKEARLTRRAVGSPPPRAGALDKAAETAAALKAQTARMDDMAAAWARLDREAAAEDLDARVAAAGLD
ncbi:MAG: PspA/IM30 family protein, partial [Pseudomonadota bacterium]